MDSRLYASGPLVGTLPIAPYSVPLGHHYARLRPGVPQSYSIEGILGVQPPFCNQCTRYTSGTSGYSAKDRSITCWKIQHT
ncbi:homeobox protein unc-4 [Caerostris extrusa]|uniref:Homeobox protein unc-4 n=1 Tax=Caerostris extrusa TaxID=172846 RepID=A0AAV4QSF8_CAEEX|nr:homeobox protein unc-4 [Caerostris extrusa]